MHMRFLISIAAALLVPAAAPAQPPEYGLGDFASDLAYGVCPLFLAGRYPLNSPQLLDRGFSKTVQKQTHPSFGDLQMIAAKRSDGEISFGGAPGKVCMVHATGAQREAALAKLRANMAATGITFEPVPHSGPAFPDVTIETFRATREGGAVYLQLVDTRGAKPSVLAQIFALAQ